MSCFIRAITEARVCSCQQAEHAAEAAKEFPAWGPPILGCRTHGWSSWQLAHRESWNFLFSGLVLWIPSFSCAALISGGCCVCACLGLAQNTCHSTGSRPSSKAWSWENSLYKDKQELASRRRVPTSQLQGRQAFPSSHSP